MGKPILNILVSINDGETSYRKIIEEASFYIGRSPENVIWLNDINISRNHLSIKIKNNKITITDNKSSNGTYINKIKCEQNKSYDVTEIDEISFGESKFKVRLDLVEKQITKETIKNSTLSSAEKKESYHLIESAQLEAHKILATAKEYLEKNKESMRQLKEMSESEIKELKEQELIKAKNQSEQIIKNAHTESEVLNKKAQENYKNEVTKLEVEIKQIKVIKLKEMMTEVDLEVKSILEKAQETEKRTKIEAIKKLEQAELESQRILDDTNEQSKKLIEESKAKIEQELQKYIFEAREKLEIEKKEFQSNLTKTNDEKISKLQKEFEIKWNEEAENKRKDLDSELETKKIIFQKDHADLIQSIESLKEKKQNLETEESKLKPLIEEIKKQHEEVNLNLKTEKLTYEKFKKDWDDQVKSLDQFKNQIDELELNLVLKRDEELRINSELKAGKIEISRIQDLEKEYKQKVLDIESKIKLDTDELNQIKQKVNQVSTEYQIQIKKIEEALEFEKKRKEKELENHFYGIKLSFDAKKIQMDQDVEDTQKKLEKLVSLKEKHQEELNLIVNEYENIKKNKEQVEPQYFLMTGDLERYKKNKEDIELNIKTLETQKSELIHNIKSLEINLETNKNELKKIETQKNKNEEHLESDSKKLFNLQTENKKLEEIRDSLSKEKEEIFNQINDMQKASADLQAQFNRLKENTFKIEQDFIKKSNELNEFQSQYVVEKSKLDNQLIKEKEKIIEEQKKFSEELQLQEIKRVKSIQDKAIEDILIKKNQIIQSSRNKVEKELVTRLNKEELREISPMIESWIRSGFEETTAGHVVDVESINTDSEKLKKKIWKERFANVAIGLFLGLSIIPLWNELDQQLNQKTYKEIVDNKIRKEKEEYESRRFNPPKVSEWQESYTELVIYTDGFVESYLSEEYQKDLTKNIMDYFFKNWRVEEEVSIKVSSQLYSLIKTLEEKRTQIHPDFVEENISKMKELELESKNKIKELLGSNVRLEALFKLEKNLFQKRLKIEKLSEN